MKIWDILTIITVKIASVMLKLLGKKAGNYPGIIALKMNKNILERLKINCPVIAVTGTNGKTTTNNFINFLFETDGKRVVSNKDGNNMTTGILTTLIQNSTLTGKVKADYITLEVDEHYVPIVFSKIKLDTLVVLDFFRDQLDRAGEMETLIQKITKFLSSFAGNVILNNDDPNVSRLGLANKENKNIYYYSVDKYKNATEELCEAGEGKFCPICKERIVYEYYQYSHIGKFECKNCGYGKNELYVKIKDVDLDTRTFTENNISYEVKHNSIYYIYNAAAVISIGKLYNIKTENIVKAIKNFDLGNGRLEHIDINNSPCELNLGKNPTGINVLIRLLNEDEEPKELMVVLNDNEPDGRDVSWIWDINFESLKNVKRVVVSGTRPYDMAIRIKYSGFDESNIEVYEKIEDAIESLFKNQGKKYIITNYTAVQETRNKLLEFKKHREGSNV